MISQVSQKGINNSSVEIVAEGSAAGVPSAPCDGKIWVGLENQDVSGLGNKILPTIAPAEKALAITINPPAIPIMIQVLFFIQFLH